MIACFAEDGPTHCSGLTVRRNSFRDLVQLFGGIEIVEERRHIHRTPGDTEHPFNWIAGRLQPDDRDDQQ